MKTPEEKNNQNRLLKEAKQRQREEFLSSLPMAKEKFHGLFNYLDEELQKHGCDHTSVLTQKYLELSNAYNPSVINWLNDHGGFCDCEVLNNVEEYFE